MSIKRTPELTAHFEAEWEAARPYGKGAFASKASYVEARWREIERREAEKAAPAKRPVNSDFKW
jgi:hypothetical protein